MYYNITITVNMYYNNHSEHVLQQSQLTCTIAITVNMYYNNHSEHVL